MKSMIQNVDCFKRVLHARACFVTDNDARYAAYLVCTPRINHAKITVNSGALDLIASVKLAATCFKLTKPSTTVLPRINPTKARFR